MGAFIAKWHEKMNLMHVIKSAREPLNHIVTFSVEVLFLRCLRPSLSPACAWETRDSNRVRCAGEMRSKCVTRRDVLPSLDKTLFPSTETILPRKMFQTKLQHEFSIIFKMDGAHPSQSLSMCHCQKQHIYTQFASSFVVFHDFNHIKYLGNIVRSPKKKIESNEIDGHRIRSANSHFIITVAKLTFSINIIFTLVPSNQATNTIIATIHREMMTVFVSCFRSIELIQAVRIATRKLYFCFDTFAKGETEPQKEIKSAPNQKLQPNFRQPTLTLLFVCICLSHSSKSIQVLLPSCRLKSLQLAAVVQK